MEEKPKKKKGGIKQWLDLLQLWLDQTARQAGDTLNPNKEKK